MTADRPDPTPEPAPERAVARPARRIWLAGVAGLAILIVAVVVAFALGRSSSSSSGGTAARAATPATSTTPTGGELDLVRRNADDPLAIGRVDAPVVLMWWADLRCPFCAKFTVETLPTLLKQYVDTGKVRIEVHEVGYFGEESVTTAVAARAAANQGKFFAYLEAVYAAAPHNGHPAMPESKLIRFAETVHVPDMAQFRTDLHDADLRAAVLQNTQQAQQFGIGSVPFFIAGRRSLAGAQPTAVFEQFLDSALAQAS